VVSDVNAATAQLRAVTAHYQGDVDQVRLVSANYGVSELHLRVPASQLESALADCKKAAVHVNREQVDAADVTREWTDNEARMRNLQAAEQQYLAILRRAGTIKDTLEVTDKLNEVRGYIEQLRAEINLMAHDVAMSSITIQLIPASQPTGIFTAWRPLQGVHDSLAALAGGVSTWVNFMLAALILLPAILLWCGTVVLGLAVLIWLVKLIARRYGKPAVVTPSGS
jgi:hypothetical protein